MYQLLPNSFQPGSSKHTLSIWRGTYLCGVPHPISLILGHGDGRMTSTEGTPHPSHQQPWIGLKTTESLGTIETSMIISFEERTPDSQVEVTKDSSTDMTSGTTPTVLGAMAGRSTSTSQFHHGETGNRGRMLGYGQVMARGREHGDAGRISSGIPAQISTSRRWVIGQRETSGRIGPKTTFLGRPAQIYGGLPLGSSGEKRTTTTSTRESTNVTSRGGILGRTQYGRGMMPISMITHCRIGASMTIGLI